MNASLDSLANGFPYLIFYLLLVSAIYVVGLVIYVRLTPHKEVALVQSGNMAAAISFSALIIGLALPLAACLINKVSLTDVFIWGSVSVLLQLFLFRMTDIILAGLSSRIINNEVAPATLLAAFKIAGSIMLAFAIAG